MLKIRCSAVGKIMTPARSKSEVLSKTCKTYIKQLAIEDYFNRKKEFTSRYTTKGIEKERDSIDLVQDTSKWNFLYKNEEQKENDYLTGTPDVVTDKVLLDVKSSWDIFTHAEHLLEDELQNKSYYWQMQGYMALWRRKKSYLIYCLPNTPQHIIEDEVRRAVWNERKIDEDEEIRSHVEHNNIFDDLNVKHRVKKFEVKYNKDDVKKLYEKIEHCREYYQSLINKFDNHIENT